MKWTNLATRNQTVKERQILGDNIVRCMLRRGVSHSALAEQTKIDLGRIYSLTKGRAKRVTDAELTKIAEALGEPEKYLRPRVTS